MPHFKPIETYHKWASRYLKVDTRGATKWLAENVPRVRGHGDAEYHGYLMRLAAEYLYFQWGQPYYKVWPKVEDALLYTDMRISGRFFNTPYPSFAIQSERFSLLATYYWRDIPENSGDVHINQLIRYINRLSNPIPDSSDRPKGTFVVQAMQDELTNIHKMDLLLFYLQISDERTIEEEIELSLSRIAEEGSGIRQLSEEKWWELSRIIRLAVGVAFFGIDQHDLVLPDVKVPVIECRGKKKRKALQVEASKRAVKACRGWLVGSEMDLPRPQYINGRSRIDGPPTKELEHGHMRSGHMKMQPCGEGRKQRKLIFVYPTVVRPDLPFKQKHGYRMKDEII